MTDISVTASAVVAGSDAVIEAGIAGATVAAGQVCYKDPADSTYGVSFKLADADGASATIRKAYGIALNSASAGQPLSVIRSGSLTMNAVLTAAVPYFLSATPGGIAPFADILTGLRCNVLGVAESTTVLLVGIINGTAAHA